MIDINKEAEEYSKLSLLNRKATKHFVTGHNSKATKAKVLYFAIDRFKSLTERQGGYSFKDVTAVLQNLEEQLKELETEILT
jgi:glycyl-tRNA synthetase beta subunit